MAEYRGYEHDNRLDAITVITAVVGLVFFFSTSPAVGLTSATIFLLALVGIAAFGHRLSNL
jgi:hypothetical protein